MNTTMLNSDMGKALSLLPEIRERRDKIAKTVSNTTLLTEKELEIRILSFFDIDHQKLTNQQIKYIFH